MGRQSDKLEQGTEDLESETTLKIEYGMRSSKTVTILRKTQEEELGTHCETSQDFQKRQPLI